MSATPLDPGPFVGGDIVRPAWQYLQRNGEMRDYRGYRSAQARVVSTISGVAGAGYWDPSTSTVIAVDKSGETSYSLEVWDITTQSLVTLTYPESELTRGTASGFRTPNQTNVSDDKLRWAIHNRDTPVPYRQRKVISDPAIGRYTATLGTSVPPHAGETARSVFSSSSTVLDGGPVIRRRGVLLYRVGDQCTNRGITYRCTVAPALPPPWLPGLSASVGDMVINNEVDVFRCVESGTAAGSGPGPQAPSLGTLQATQRVGLSPIVTDGSVRWTYLPLAAPTHSSGSATVDSFYTWLVVAIDPAFAGIPATWNETNIDDSNWAGYPHVVGVF